MACAFGIDDVPLLPSGWLTTRMFAVGVKSRDQAVRWLLRLDPAEPGSLRSHFDIVRAPPYRGHAAYSAALFVDLMREQQAPFTLHAAADQAPSADGFRVGYEAQAFRLGEIEPTGEPLGPALDPDDVSAWLAGLRTDA